MLNSSEDLTPAEALQQAIDLVLLDDAFANAAVPVGPPELEPELASKSATRATSGNISQWAIGGNGFYSPVSRTATAIPAGVYQAHAIPGGPTGLLAMPIQSDGIYELPDMVTNEILAEAERFWDSEPLYRKHNLLYRRGILLTGPPGGGKTITIKMLMKQIIARDGIGVMCNHVGLTSKVLKDFRTLEPNRKVVVVFEDLDEIINYNGEAAVLSILDGEHNIDNVLNVASTNFVDRLGARIANRPSRFDRRVEIGMPSSAARRAYLTFATDSGLSDADLDLWTAQTDKMSIAHLRELVASVYCLGQSFDSVLERLRSMAVIPRVKDEGFRAAKTPGFGFGAGVQNTPAEEG